MREIVYGMPGPDFDFDKYIVGGCCVTGVDPRHGCKKCGWRGFLLRSEFVSVEAKPSEFVCPSCGEVGSMRQILQIGLLGELKDVIWKFTRTYEDEPAGNVVCEECGWNCVGRDWSSWVDY